MRLPITILLTGAVVALALAAGVLRPGPTTRTLQRHAELAVARCMDRAGFHGAGEARFGATTTPRSAALDRCWSATARDPAFARLALVDPVAYARKLRADGLAAWTCVERAGYVRTTGIPLSGRDGYPLQIAAGNFRVGDGDVALERFYRAAARCSGDRLADYRWSDGRFSRDPADGTRRCIHRAHNGSGVHEHGCFFTDPRSGARQ